MKLNGFSWSTTYTYRAITHEPSTPQELNIMKLSRRDGAKLISSNFGVKQIKIEGLIKGTSQANLEANVDTFKQAMMVTDGSLDVPYAGIFKRYKVNANNLTITRDYYHLTFVPYEVTFTVCDPPFGQEVSAEGGSLVLTEACSVNNVTAQRDTSSFSIGGSVYPSPTINLVLDTVGNLGNINIYNTTTNRSMDIATVWANGDRIEIDTDSLTVQKNYTNVEFEGVFPEFNLGDNNFEINMTAIGGLNQTQPLYSSDATTNSNWVAEAQSFKITPTGLYDKIQLLIKKNSTFNSDEVIEEFASTTYKDTAGGVTTADWNTVQGKLLFPRSSTESLVSSYGIENRTLDWSMWRADVYRLSESFQCNGNIKLTSCKFSLRKNGSPTGTAVAKLYSHSGTFGSSGPASLLATSDSVDISILTSTYGLYTFSFSGANQYEMVNGYYHIVLEIDGGTNSNWVEVGMSNASIAGCVYDFTDSGGWFGPYSQEMIYYVYGKQYDTTNNIGQSLGYDTGRVTNSFLTGTQSVALNGGTSTLEFSDSADNSGWSGWTSYITTLTQRYIRFRITLGGSTSASPIVDNVSITLAGYMEVNICSDSTGYPGSILATTYIPYTSLGDSYNWIDVPFSLTLTSGTTYWVWIKPSLLIGSSRTIYWAYEPYNVYADGSRSQKLSIGASWTNYSSYDHAFKVYKSTTTGWHIDYNIKYVRRYL